MSQANRSNPPSTIQSTPSHKGRSPEPSSASFTYAIFTMHLVHRTRMGREVLARFLQGGTLLLPSLYRIGRDQDRDFVIIPASYAPLGALIDPPFGAFRFFPDGRPA